MIIRVYTLLAIAVIAVASCTTSKKIKDGRTAYQQKQYARAISMLEAEAVNEEDPVKYAELSYFLGECYKNINDSDNSLKWYIESAKNNYGPESYWEMAFALKKKQRYEDAILSFRRLEKMTTRKDEIKKEIEKCLQARIWTDENGDHAYILEALELNSPESDYAPTLLDDQYLVFTSDRTDEIEGEIYQWTGNAFSDVFISEIDGTEIRSFHEAINTLHNEGTTTFNQDGSEMFFSRCFSEVGDSYCRILRSVKLGDQWSFGEEVFEMKRNVNYTDPMLIENDEVLIFSSDDPTGIGGRDLYYTIREEDGSWSIPELMPPYLNTLGNERFPTWHEGTMYYSSDFLAGLGGLDIFKTTLNDDGSWTRPQNMMAPINSSEDDYSYVIRSADKYPPGVKLQAFFTSTRGIFGSDDIYALTEVVPLDDTPTVVDTTAVVTETPQPDERSFFLEVRVREKLYALPEDPNSYVVGTRPVSGASVKLSNANGETLVATDANGRVVVNLDTTADYTILVGKSGYLNDRTYFDSESLDYRNFADGHVFDVDVEIEKLYADVEIVLEDIFYEFDKWDIQDSAKPSLNYLIRILEENPALRIQLASHTDCRGELDYNNDLSLKRAQSAVSYIMAEGGIDPARLSSVGFGETKPEIDCVCEQCSEDEHQINRRTTFTIVSNQ